VSATPVDPHRPVALVTGGSRGIGRAIAVRLGRDGFDVGLCYRSRTEAAAEVVHRIEASGARAVARQVDVSEADAVREFVAAVEHELGSPDVAVTSAGIVRDAPLLTMDDRTWSSVVRTNLDGTYHVCRAVLPLMMKRRRGAIVTLASIAGVYGSAGQTNYSASKAGIIGFTRALAKEYGRYGVRANVVAPGFIETDMTADVPQRLRERYRGLVPLARFGMPEDVAELVAFLTSDRAAYITGQVVGIDGGLVI
jgi:3-oxoacyl-[acyl-carrier protein] reductase